MQEKLHHCPLTPGISFCAGVTVTDDNNHNFQVYGHQKFKTGAIRSFGNVLAYVSSFGGSWPTPGTISDEPNVMFNNQVGCKTFCLFLCLISYREQLPMYTDSTCRLWVFFAYGLLVVQCQQ